MKGFAQTFLRTRHTVSTFFIDFFKSKDLRAFLRPFYLKLFLFALNNIVLGQNDVIFWNGASFWVKTTYRVFIKYCVFSLKFWDFSELCQFCCSAGFLPAWWVYKH